MTEIFPEYSKSELIDRFVENSKYSSSEAVLSEIRTNLLGTSFEQELRSDFDWKLKKFQT